MTVRPVLSIGHPTLRVRAHDVSVDDISSERVQTLIDDLVETMRDANGAGLAATQIDERLRIAVMEVGDDPRYPDKPRIPLTVAINPIIEPLDDEMVEVDGVLFIDRVTDRSTLASWDEFDRHQRDAFAERISAFVERVGS